MNNRDFVLSVSGSCLLGAVSLSAPGPSLLKIRWAGPQSQAARFAAARIACCAPTTEQLLGGGQSREDGKRLDTKQEPHIVGVFVWSVSGSCLLGAVVYLHPGHLYSKFAGPVHNRKRRASLPLASLVVPRRRSSPWMELRPGRKANRRTSKKSSPSWGRPFLVSGSYLLWALAWLLPGSFRLGVWPCKSTVCNGRIAALTLALLPYSLDLLLPLSSGAD